MPAGAIVVDRWFARGHARLKGASFIAAAALSGALTAYLTLPILPVSAFVKSSLPTLNAILAEQVGWPEFVATVEGVVAALPPDQRARAVILTNDYSEASPLVLLGTGLPPVFSGHNAYWDWGPPADDRTVVVHVGDWRPADWTPFFTGCHTVAHVDNGLALANSEQGKPIDVCSGLRASWSALWPSLRAIS